ncbi:MAG: substrate-binding domain-containing protein [Fimbriimonadales bacterium]|nr:substrate-binding domain-containing protein [Fimbriimonadales bacterium]
MRIRTWTGWVGLAVGALWLAGCSGGGTSEQPKTEPGKAGGAQKAEGVVWAKDKLRITMIAKSDNNPVFPTARKGAEDAAKELSAQTGVQIEIDWRTPPTENAEEQAKRLQQAVNDGTDVALMSLSDAAKVTNAINDAVAKGVPVMTFDSDAPGSKRFAFYGVDDIETGQLVMDELAKVIGEKGNVAILAGNQNAPNLQKRVQGVREAAKKYPGVKILGVFYHVESPQDAAKEVLNAMNANPEINAWAMVGGWPLFTPSLLNLDPNKVKIVAVDCLPEQLPYVEKGIAPVLLAQPTYKWGYDSVKIIADKLLYGKEVPEVTKMQLVRVSKETLKDWAQQLKEWGFDKVDPKYLQ